jgi:hypothetical protein
MCPGRKGYNLIICQLSHHINIGSLNDLWMYNITSSQWTWVSGNSVPNVAGVYGSNGIASATNYPGSRYSHDMIMDLINNRLFLFGGNGYGQTSSTEGKS